MTEETTTTPAGQLVPAYAAVMPAPQGGALPTGLEWQALERMAATLAESDLIPYRLKRKPGDVAVILLAAREYGIPPLMALSKLPVVNGTPAPMGELMIALVLRAGHYIAADFRNPDGSTYMGGEVTPQHYGEARYRRADWPEQERMTFTLDEALTAGLIDRITNGKAIARVTKTKNGNPVEEVTPWEQYTPNMARWRAVANACRLAFADVLMGLSYLPEELGAVVDADGAPVEVEYVGPRGGATGTLEQRTAQESADKLAEQPWHDGVIDALRATATEGGYLDTMVTYQGERMTFAEALTRHVEDRKHADTVDAVIVEPTAGELAQQTADALAKGGHTLEVLAEVQARSRAAGHVLEEVDYRGERMILADALIAARVEAENPPPDGQESPQEPRTPPPGGDQSPGEAPAPHTEVEHGTGSTLSADAAEVAVEALTSGDPEYVRGLYRGSTDLLAIDVRDTVTAEDLEALGMDPNILTEFGVPLGGLLHKVGDYVGRHGNPVRHDPTARETGPGLFSSPEDPWADGSGSGTPPTDGS